MKIKNIIFRITYIALIILVQEKLVFSKLKVKTKMYSRYIDIKDTKLNPDNILSLYDTKIYHIDIMPIIKTRYRKIKVYIKDEIKYEIESKGDDESYNFKNKLQQAYITISDIQKGYFIDIGKMVYSKGVAFLKNPSNFVIVKTKNEKGFAENKEDRVDYLEGDILVNFEYYIDENKVIRLLYIPIIKELENINELEIKEISFFYQGNSSDFEISIAAISNNLAFGLNYSITLNKFLEFHIEGSILEKDERIAIKEENFILKQYKEEISFPFSFIMGSVITIDNENDIYIEYYHQNLGIGNEEWDDIKDGLSTSPPLLYLNATTLANYINEVGFLNIRRDYMFIRYEIKNLLDIINLYINYIYEINGKSKLYIARLEYDKLDNLLFISEIAYSSDDGLEEFGLYPYKLDLVFEVRLFF
jgi:hypothetical protein